MLKIATKAPEFCLPNQDETEICLRDLNGKWVVLYFYPKDNTAGCSTEACDFSNEKENFANMDAVILGVSPDSPKKHRNFIKKKDLTITLLSDEEKTMLQNYEVWQRKKMFGKEYMGVVRTTYIINPNGEIAFIWNNVKVKNHIQTVKEQLTKLQDIKKKS